MQKFLSHSESETLQIAANLAALLRPGDVLCLSGDLGAGKTVFSQGLCAALGVADIVNSPTFTIVNEYESKDGMVYHFDLYRIEDAGELYETGFDEYLTNGGICIIEWPERVPEALPSRRTDVRIERALSEGDMVRIMTIEEHC